METNTSESKTRIYNLIILDKSGSMHTISQAAYEGCNEVLGGIRTSAEKHESDQEQFVSLLLFDSDSMPYIYKCTPAHDVTDLKQEDYVPCACTPLLDAMGMSLTELEKETDKYEDAVGMVTIITDGYENASREFTYPQIHEMVDRLKHKGWNFAFMGANQDVTKVCTELNINIGNAFSFSFDEEGMRDSWRRDREAKERYYQRMSDVKARSAGLPRAKRAASYFDMNSGFSYFDEPETDSRNTPERVTHLAPNEIFVFGSNAAGMHGGGAAAYAYHHFGAIWGQGEGLQGQSYAIPTMGTLAEMQEAINRFLDFAQQHQEMKFYVTAVGCGVAGYHPSDIAPLFHAAVNITNICLPHNFWIIINA